MRASGLSVGHAGQFSAAINPAMLTDQTDLAFELSLASRSSATVTFVTVMEELLLVVMSSPIVPPVIYAVELLKRNSSSSTGWRL